MTGSHTSTDVDHTVDQQTRLELVSTVDAGLPETLAGRVDGHLEQFAAHMREGLLAASTAVGLEVMAELMQAEVTELAGPKGKHGTDRTHNWHGTDPGSVTLGRRRVPVRRPRMRTVAGEHTPERERPLGSYEAFADSDLLTEGIGARMLAGISTRRYPVGWSRWASRSPSPRGRRRSRRCHAGL